MAYYPEKDKTKTDNNRTLLNLHRAEIDTVLPEYISTEFPKLKALFEAYYKWMDSAENPNGMIHELYKNRDATQVPSKLLSYLEDELLLGQATFGGFLNKREAIKFSNQLYRSKGTKYSAEQFFRGFYGVDPQVIYPKENIFLVGPQIDQDQDSTNLAGEQIKRDASQLGPESQKYITDDKLYQIMSVLIKSSIPTQEWSDAYKLFVHPAGAYLGAQLVLELVNGNVVQSLRESGAGIPATYSFQFEGIGNINALGVTDTTLIQRGDGTVGAVQGMVRADTRKTFKDLINMEGVDSGKWTTFDSAGSFTFKDLISPNSLLMDDDGIVTYEINGSPSQYNEYTYYDSGNTVRRFAVMFGNGPYRGHNTGMFPGFSGITLPMYWNPINLPKHLKGSGISTWYQPVADYTDPGFDSSNFVNPEHIVGKPVNSSSDKVANIPGLIVKHPTNPRYAFRIDSDVYTTYDLDHPNAPFGVFSGYRFPLTLMVAVSSPATFDRDSGAEALLPRMDEHKYLTIFDSSRFKTGSTITPIEDYMNDSSADSAHWPFQHV